MEEEAIAKWPGQMRSAEETASRGSWALLSVNVCKRGGKIGEEQWVSHSHCIKNKCTSPSPLQESQFSVFPSVIFKILIRLPYEFYLNNSQFLYQKYHAGLFRKGGSHKRTPVIERFYAIQGKVREPLIHSCVFSQQTLCLGF